ncbi:zinc finger BED domain-containing protein 1-like [Sipha flava]|uniref:Zinc finger BED domain-containing protein 1-like n=1 Tax=Sipha flava TaxID=143950 RepID=A0A8B8FQE2_9HEMI|nr:zinc finger BED domain-containing protein 1-like [Sipha flava]
MIFVDYQPLSLVDNIGFLEYSKKLQPLYKPPSRKTLTMKLLPDEYNKIATILKSMLRSVNNVSITTDMWTSDSNRAYLTVTGHFIFNDRLYSPNLSTREIIKIHTGANIATSISAILIE